VEGSCEHSNKSSQINKILGNYGVDEQVVASLEGLGSLELVGEIKWAEALKDTLSLQIRDKGL
jgi:hypothetical protein